MKVNFVVAGTPVRTSKMAADLTASGTPAPSAVQVQGSSFQDGLASSGVAMRSSPRGAGTDLLCPRFPSLCKAFFNLKFEMKKGAVCAEH